MVELPPPRSRGDHESFRLGPPEQRRRRAGELTPGWAVAFMLGWLGVLIGFAAVWAVSRQLGLSTWWLGPRAQPRPLLVSILPVVPSVLLIAGAAARVRHLPWLGLAGAVALAAVAAGDLDRVAGIAVVEFALATAGALASIAAFTGMYRSSPTRIGAAGEPAER